MNDGWNHPNYASTDGQPTMLTEIFAETDLEQVILALNATRRPCDESLARLAPAAVYGRWLECIGLPGLAARARTELAETTVAGDGLIATNELFASQARALGVQIPDRDPRLR